MKRRPLAAQIPGGNERVITFGEVQTTFTFKRHCGYVISSDEIQMTGAPAARLQPRQKGNSGTTQNLTSSSLQERLGIQNWVSSSASGREECERMRRFAEWTGEKAFLRGLAISAANTRTYHGIVQD